MSLLFQIDSIFDNLIEMYVKMAVVVVAFQSLVEFVFRSHIRTAFQDKR